MKSRKIKVDYLARVEGEGRLIVKIKNDAVSDVQFNIFEPPRFFEAFLRGRKFTEVPDITARICGICPVAYQMSSVHAMEMACGVTVDGPLRELRR
ncbi:MAG: nickel-dependent hydrogenase large subunit, partial [Candidatus Zixiibacteriota bacterium]